MKAVVWNAAIPTELPGNIVELVWVDGRTVQLSTSPDDSGLCLLRCFPPDGKGDIDRNTDMSMAFSFTPAGLEIRSLNTNLPDRPGRYAQ